MTPPYSESDLEKKNGIITEEIVKMFRNRESSTCDHCERQYDDSVCNKCLAQRLWKAIKKALDSKDIESKAALSTLRQEKDGEIERLQGRRLAIKVQELSKERAIYFETKRVNQSLCEEIASLRSQLASLHQCFCESEEGKTLVNGNCPKCGGYFVAKEIASLKEKLASTEIRVREEVFDEICKTFCKLCGSDRYNLRETDYGFKHYGKITRDIIDCDASDIHAIRQQNRESKSLTGQSEKEK